jgi:hypothetical protein
MTELNSFFVLTMPPMKDAMVAERRPTLPKWARLAALRVWMPGRYLIRMM